MSESLPQPTEYWFPVSAALVKHPGISPAAKITWLVLCAYRDHTTGKAWPSQHSLMMATGLGVIKIRRAIKELQEIGAITASSRIRNGQRLDNHVHTLLGMDSTQVISPATSSLPFQNNRLKQPLETTASNVTPTRSIQQDPITKPKQLSWSSEHDQEMLLKTSEAALNAGDFLGLPEDLSLLKASEVFESFKAGLVTDPVKAVFGLLEKVAEDRTR